MDKIITYLGFIIGLIGLILAILFYIKSKKKKKIHFIKKTFKLLTKPNDLPKLDIFYDEKKVEKMIITRFLIINVGNEIINGSEISNHDPLTILLPIESQVFDVKILFANKKANMFTTVQNKNSIDLTFDFLDVGDGVVLQIIHDVENGDNINLLGTIKGARIVEKRVNKSSIKKNIFQVVFFTLCIGVGILGGSTEFFGFKLYIALPIILVIVSTISFLLWILENKLLKNKYLVDFEKFL